MAYQNVCTPRFNINDISYAKSIGIDITDLEGAESNSDTPYTPVRFGLDNHYKLVDDDPTNSIAFTPETQNECWVRYKTFLRNTSLECNYVAYLNHNIATSRIYARHSYRTITGGWNNGHHLESIVNGENGEILNTVNDGSSTFAKPENNGFSIYKITNTSADGYNKIHDIQFQYSNDDMDDFREFRMGSIFVGRYFDMPVSPDLDLSMTVEFDGYDTTTTLGGSTLTNIRYTGAPWWRDSEGNKIEPWHVGASPGTSKRNGRRMWSMKFSYISDKDIFASNYMSNTYLESGSGSGYDTDDDLVLDSNDEPTAFYNTLENDDSFVAQVLNKVGNGQRFIFQPDNTNNNPDQFAICQLDQDSLEIKQVAFKTYNISLKIREVW